MGGTRLIAASVAALLVSVAVAFAQDDASGEKLAGEPGTIEGAIVKTYPESLLFSIKVEKVLGKEGEKAGEEKKEGAIAKEASSSSST